MPRINNLGGGGFTGFASMSKQPTGGGGGGASYLAGSYMLFSQTSAPTDWTKSATYDDYSLRIVSGTASTGGSVNFSSVFTNISSSPSPATFPGSSGAFQLTAATVTQHVHTGAQRTWSSTRQSGPQSPPTSPVAYANNFGVSYTGGASPNTTTPHSHPFTSASGTMAWDTKDFRVKYLDVIIASRNS